MNEEGKRNLAVQIKLLFSKRERQLCLSARQPGLLERGIGIQQAGEQAGQLCLGDKTVDDAAF